MSVSLTNNFFARSRGITLKDSAQVVWSINKNTNEITAVAAGALGGTVTSVGLSDGSGTPIYTISGSPVSGAGTLTFTFNTQNANLVLAGPTSGGAAQPTFRALVAADVQSIAPTWSGAHAFTGGVTITAAAAGPVYATLNSTNAGGGYLALQRSGTTLGFIGNTKNVIGTNLDDLCIDATGAHGLQLATNDVIRLSIDSNGLSTFVKAIGVNNSAPPAQVTGFGTPVGAAVIASYNITDAGGANSNTNKCVAEILTILKAVGFIAA